MSRKNLNYQLKSNGNVPLDYKETPLKKVAELNDIPLSDRFLGMTVTVLDAGDGKPADYWYIGDNLYSAEWKKKTFGEEDGSNHVINGENPDNVNVIVNGEGKTFAYSNDKFGEDNGYEIATTWNIHKLKRILKKKKDRGGRVVPSHATLQYPFVGLGDIALVTPKSRRIFKMLDGEDNFNVLPEGGEENSFFYQIDGCYEYFINNRYSYGIIREFDTNTGKLYLDKNNLDKVFEIFYDYTSLGILVKDDGRQVSGCGHIWYSLDDPSVHTSNDCYVFTLPPRTTKWGGSKKIKVFIRLDVTDKLRGHIITNRGGLNPPKVEPCYGGQLIPVQRHNMFYSVDGKTTSWMPQGVVMPLRSNPGFDNDSDKYANHITLSELVNMLMYNTHQIWIRTGPNSYLHSETKYRRRNYHFAWRQFGRNRKGKVRKECFRSFYCFYNPKDGKLYGDIRRDDGTYINPISPVRNGNDELYYNVYMDENTPRRDGWYCPKADGTGFAHIDTHEANTINNVNVAEKVIKGLFNRWRITLRKQGSIWSAREYLYVDFAVFKNTSLVKKGKWGRDIPENVGKIYRLVAKQQGQLEEWEFDSDLQYRGTITYFKNRR